MARVTASSGFSGESVGVRFVEGVASDVPEGPALAYFRRSAGYAVEDEPAGTTRADRGDDEGQDDEDQAPAPPSRKRKS